MVALLLAALTVAGCRTSSNTRNSALPVRIALTNVPLAYLPVILADALGYYRQEGLSVRIDTFSTASQVLQSLLGGSADIAAGAYEQDIQMAAEGRPIKSFVLLLRHPSRVLLVSPNRAKTIRQMEDLKGAVIDVGGLGGVNHSFLNYVLLKHGIAPEQVKVIAISTGASAVAAIEYGRVDAAVLSGSESTVAMRRVQGSFALLDTRGAAGCRRLYGVDAYPTAVLQATDPWLQKHPETARRVAQSVQKTLTWISQHSPEEIRAATPERYRLADKDAELNQPTGKSDSQATQQEPRQS